MAQRRVAQWQERISIQQVSIFRKTSTIDVNKVPVIGGNLRFDPHLEAEIIKVA